ncbi:MAG TPA: RDD family protein [Actinomycetota bacterium]|nr:RDD family protein [Actinomycetota bacterium]
MEPTVVSKGLEDRIIIATPEGVEVELTLAGLGSRFIAAMVDSIIKWLITFAIFLLFGGGFSALSPDAPTASDDVMVGLAIGIVIVFVIQTFYDIGFEVWAEGRTPGKRWTGLRVVDTEGGPVRFRASAVRNLLRIVDMLPGAYFAGMVTVLISKKSQRIGDIFASTLVIRDRRTRPAAPRRAFAPPAFTHGAPPQPGAAWGWDVSAITTDEVITVRRFLERRAGLPPEVRWRLAWELAERLRPKLAGVPQGVHPEYLLEQIANIKASRG